MTVSPCALNTSTVWHVAVMLEDHATAVSRGVAPTRFELSVHLENALLDPRSGSVAPRGGDAADLPAKGQGGDGFVCCGGFKYFLLPSVPAHLSVAADLTVTKGAARGVFLKAQACPAFPADVEDGHCLGRCVVELPPLAGVVAAAWADAQVGNQSGGANPFR